MINITDTLLSYHDIINEPMIPVSNCLEYTKGVKADIKLMGVIIILLIIYIIILKIKENKGLHAP